MYDVAQGSEWHFITNLVDHHCAVRFLGKGMGMMPQLVRTLELPVNEAVRRISLGDFGLP